MGKVGVGMDKEVAAQSNKGCPTKEEDEHETGDFEDEFALKETLAIGVLAARFDATMVLPYGQSKQNGIANHDKQQRNLKHKHTIDCKLLAILMQHRITPTPPQKEQKQNKKKRIVKVV